MMYNNIQYAAEVIGINIEVKRSKRKTISIEVNASLSVVVRVPLKYPDNEIPKLLEKHSAWIDKALNNRKIKNLNHPEPTAEEAAMLAKKAGEILPSKIDYYSKLTGLVPTQVKITGAKKRFGSCSTRNSICFSYLLMQYPESCIDYVVLHEIAHIKHHNHSKDFYAFIETYMPDFRNREKQLKGF